jgi:hypothetical protein
MFLEFIRSKVEEKFGKVPSCTDDFLTLSLEIFERTNFRLSTATLEGVFETNTSIMKPSLFTLEVLANYLGYASSAQMRTEFNYKHYTSICVCVRNSVDG